VNLPNTTFTRIPYTNVLYDDATEYDATMHTFSPKANGHYEICASLASWATVLTLPFELDVFINGNRERAIAGGAGAAQGCRTVRLTAGQVVDVEAYQASGSTVNIAPDNYWDWLTIQLVTSHVSLGDSAPFVAPSGTFTKVPYSMVLYDDSKEWTTTNDFVAASSGDYEVCASLTSIPASATLGFELDVFIDGARDVAFAGGGSAFQGGCHTVRINAGQKLDVELYQGSGSSVSFASNVYWNWLTVSKVNAHASVNNIGAFMAAGNTFTDVPYANTQFDNLSEFNPGTHTFTASQAGDYAFCSSLTSYPASVTLGFELDLYIDGNRERAFAGGGSGFQQGCRTVRLGAGQAVKVSMYQGGSTVSVTPDTYWDWWTIEKRK
jgi:hypothetical protein